MGLINKVLSIGKDELWCPNISNTYGILIQSQLYGGTSTYYQRTPSVYNSYSQPALYQHSIQRQNSL